MVEQRRPMARSCRCALLVAVLVLLFDVAAFTGLHPLAQAPDYEEFIVPADAELGEGDCYVPPETEVGVGGA